jgi:anti-sigma regulatory factor (Ser/Thr protein kinase)
MIIPVAEISQVGNARRLATEFAQKIGLEATRIASVALVATEMATNLVKHGGGGKIVIDHFADADGCGIELLSLDQGSGMADVGRCLADGFSTAGSAGNGLGAIKRQADGFAVFSRPGLGTALMVRFIAKADRGPASGTQLGIVADPYPGESVNGDCWAYADTPHGPTVLVADGLGHGIQAAEAAQIGIKTFHQHLDYGCVPLIDAIHRALAPTRGAAVGLARIDKVQQLVRFVGIGNIGAALVSQGVTRRLASNNGTAGHIAPRIHEFTYPFAGDPLVILHSDGLSAKWELGAYPGLAMNHPLLIAGVLFRDHRRGRDDASIVAVRVVS